MNTLSRRFLDELNQRVLVCDGAMGTVLYAKGIPITRCFEELNLIMPSVVKEVHESYHKAGAEIIETNTFSANPVRLESFGLRDKCRDINAAGVRLARQAVGDKGWVAGAVGPLGVRLAPLGPCTPDLASAAFQEQMLALANAGADLIMLETFQDFEEVSLAIAAAKAVCDLPIVAQITIDDAGHLPAGTPPEDFTLRLAALKPDVLGCNCSIGPSVMLETIQRMALLTALPLCAQPNAGLPVNVSGRNIYLCSPEYMASFVARFIQSGVQLAGGCCGTTAEHIRAIAAAVRSVQPPRPKIGGTAVAAKESDRSLPPLPVADRSSLAAKLAAKKFVVLAEIIPSPGCDPSQEIAGAQYLADNNVDAILVRDGSRSGARLSALVLAHLIQQHAGIETVLQYSCRDRNVISIQSDLLGAHGLGLRNLLLITGGHLVTDNYPDATAVFDVDSVGLTKIVYSLNQGVDLGGNFLGSQTCFWVAISADSGAVNFQRELERITVKKQLGADCLITRPIFDINNLERYLDKARELTIPMIAGVTPLTSLRHAEFLANELQIPVPESIMDRMRKAASGEAARQEGLRIAAEIVAWLEARVQGMLITAPLGRYDSAIEVLSTLCLRQQSSGAPLD